MSSYVRLDRVVNAVSGLSDWRGTARKQATAHVLPLLALVEKGVNKLTPTIFEESDDFSFFDRYCKVAGDPTRPYFDPFCRELRIASHPHSNIATARKSTFQHSWLAGTQGTGPNGATTWVLSGDFAEKFATKLEVSGTFRRLNLLDLACWLFREKEFPNGADSQTLLDHFRSTFQFDDDDFDRLFEYVAEPPAVIFQATPVPQPDLDNAISALALTSAVRAVTRSQPPVTPTTVSLLPEDDPVLDEVKSLIQLGTSGIIFRGAPGTGKSWYAQQIARALTGGDETRIFRVQFHPSFTYEDFVDGYSPDEGAKSGFKVSKKIFREAIEFASSRNDAVVFIIDEINRGNTSKIFGELLTYIEVGWRGVEFIPRLSGEKISVPSNLIVLATMNPHDRSISALDMALLRRFDQIDIPPDADRVAEFLAAAGMPEDAGQLVATWFQNLQSLVSQGIGHTFFKDVGNSSQLSLVWRYRLLPFCRVILEFDPALLKSVEDSFDALKDRLREAGH